MYKMYITYHHKKIDRYQQCMLYSMRKQTRVIGSTTRMQLDPELCIRQPLFVYTWSPINIPRYVFQISFKDYLKFAKRSSKQIT